MFHSVGHAGHVVFVAEVADIDVEGGTGLVRLGIVDKQGLELVVEADDTIVAVVERGLLETVRQQGDGGVPGRGRGRGLGGGHAVGVAVREGGTAQARERDEGSGEDAGGEGREI